MYMIPTSSSPTTIFHKNKAHFTTQQSFQHFKPPIQSQERFSLSFSGAPANKGWLTKFTETIKRWWNSVLIFLKLKVDKKQNTNTASQVQGTESAKPNTVDSSTTAAKLTRTQLESELKEQEAQQGKYFKEFRLAKWNLSQVFVPPLFGMPLDKESLKKEAIKVSDAARVFFQNLEKQEQTIKTLELEYKLDLSTKKKSLSEAKNQFSKYNQPPNDLERAALEEMETINIKLAETEKEMMPEIEALQEKKNKGELTEEEAILQYQKIMQKMGQSLTLSH